MQDHQRIAERMFWGSVHSANGLVKRMLREMACTVGTCADVMEVDGKVERHAEARWVPGRQRAERVLVRSLVGFQRQLRRPLAFLTSREFREVPVIIPLPVTPVHTHTDSQERMTKRERWKEETCILR